MAWLRNLSPQHRKTLEYFDKYDYPLTKKELEYWSGTKVQRHKGAKHFFHLTKRSSLINIRIKREKYSLLKWGIAYKQAIKFAKIPFVEAVYVTGSLAMNNCKKSDDIDFMVVTSANTLWIARLMLTFIFWKQRRLPSQKTAPDKVCLNLWLDIKNLKLKIKNLYIAHEILQAKCIFDRGGIQYQFLKQNSWMKSFLPNTFRKSYQVLSVKYHAKPIIHNTNPIIQILNRLLFILQYLYMKPKMTTEKVGIGFAFFHPKS